jgi:hypothetical protein
MISYTSTEWESWMVISKETYRWLDNDISSIEIVLDRLEGNVKEYTGMDISLDISHIYDWLEAIREKVEVLRDGK